MTALSAREPSVELTDRNVYILGAGFSADAGAPLIYNFLDISRELLDHPLSSLNATDKQQFRRAFTFRQRMAQSREKIRIDLDNIEQLFGLADMLYRLDLEGEQTRLTSAVSRKPSVYHARHGQRVCILP